MGGVFVGNSARGVNAFVRSGRRFDFLSRWEANEAVDFVKQLEMQFDADFSPADGHWSEDDRRELLAEALRRLEAEAPSPLIPPPARPGRKPVRTPEQDAAEARQREAWQHIVADFHRGGYWGRVPRPGRAPKVKKPLTEAQLRRKELWPYIWAFFQSTIIMKFVIYYFGINSADDPSVWNYAGLGVGIFVSFFSLFFFAWRHHRKMKKLGLEDTV